MVQPTLSLCMIIRDEEKMLPQFLEKSQGLWDELCVVDTGSKDASINLLRDAGAKIEEHPWFDDFAAARNLSLDMATGGWMIRSFIPRLNPAPCVSGQPFFQESKRLFMVPPTLDSAPVIHFLISRPIPD